MTTTLNINNKDHIILTIYCLRQNDMDDRYEMIMVTRTVLGKCYGNGLIIRMTVS